MLDRDAATGEFTFGVLQTYSTKSGVWVAAQSRELDEVTRGTFVTKTDHGLPSDLLQGVKMKIADKRSDVQWYPPL